MWITRWRHQDSPFLDKSKANSGLRLAGKKGPSELISRRTLETEKVYFRGNEKARSSN